MDGIPFKIVKSESELESEECNVQFLHVETGKIPVCQGVKVIKDIS